MNRFSDYIKLRNSIKIKEKAIEEKIGLNIEEINILYKLINETKKEMFVYEIDNEQLMSISQKNKYIYNLKKLNYISKKRFQSDERHVILYLNSEQSKKVDQLIKNTEILISS